MLNLYKTNKYNNIMLYGEAAGAEEEKQGKPFVGPSGKLLDAMLEEAGLSREECIISNIFMSERPPNNWVNHFFVGIQEASKNNVDYCEDIPRYNGKYLRECFRFEMDRIRSEIEEHKPKVIVALGATAMWGIVGLNGITSRRGQQIYSRKYSVEIIPTFHPAAVLRDRKNKRDLVVEDFKLAKRLLEEPQFS